MKMLGIDHDTRYLVYEGSSLWGYPTWPVPTLVAVSIIDESSKKLKPEKSQSDIALMDFVLVDEGYDPTSRVRRGRLFKRYEGTQPSEWHIAPHPIFPKERPSTKEFPVGPEKKRLGTYSEFSLTSYLKQEGIDRPLFILGSEREYTIWSLVDVESSVSGEPLVYLKARKVFGALPKLNIDTIPAEYLERVQEKLNILAEDLYRAVPESIIDRCRDTVTAILSAYLQEIGEAQPGNDLGDLAKIYDTKVNPKNQLIAGQARTINRLHSRGKNAEQEMRGVRPPTEADAELAVQAVGVILRDLGWAN